MLFNSLTFLFIFLPITVCGFFLIANRSQFIAAVWLALASIVFYGCWNYRYVVLLLVSIIFNYGLSRKISDPTQSKASKKFRLTFAISANLIVLGYYKYANFFVSSITSLTDGLEPISLGIVLPLGISFFTFTQIAFLVDTYQGKVDEQRFIYYVLFVTYFPHLIAGPVLHHKEMMPQFADKKNYRPKTINFVTGNTIFFIGLAKKILIADNLAPYASQLFDHTVSPTFFAAWEGVFAYTFQIYFDFSGYSDMAIGLSLLFGIQLPLNFNSPYKATNIGEFWRRWHMTLSHFLRDYLYIPLGGNRKGNARRYVNLLLTMLLGGLWHGTGWNFVIWGGMHGLYLVIHQMWAALAAKRFKGGVNSPLTDFGSTMLTFIAVCFAWVFFRSSDLTVALHIIKGMLGQNSPISLAAADQDMGLLKSQAEFGFLLSWVSVIAFLLPNTQTIVTRYVTDTKIGATSEETAINVAIKYPNPVLPIALGIISAIALMNLSHPSEFLYFNF